MKSQDIKIKNQDKKLKPGSFTALRGMNGLNSSIFIDRLSRLTFFLGSWFLVLDSHKYFMVMLFFAFYKDAHNQRRRHSAKR